MEQVSPQVDFPKLEEQVLAKWQAEGTFQLSLERRKDAPKYMFYDGPPFATGLPHYGHLLAGTIKDIVPRYHAMSGKNVERRFGWDTHGLPVEMLVENELGLKGPDEVAKLGVAKFNEACKASVFKYEKEWRRVVARLGRWVDFDNDYKTLDRSFMESVWWVFKQLWDQGRVYEGRRVMPYSWRLGTPLSNFEAGLNFKDTQDPSVTVRLRLKERPGVNLLVWTTTPWTLVSNVAACVHPEIQYVHAKTKDGEEIITSEASLARYFKKGEAPEVLNKFPGRDLIGIHYEPLFSYFLSLAEQGAFRVVADEYVTNDDGTGVVHQAPAFGEDDYRVAQREKLPLIDPVDTQGNFNAEITLVVGQNFKEADKTLVADLKARGLLFKHEVLNHSYPFCYRSDTPLMYRAISAWYVRVEDLREKMVANNSVVHWIPEYVKDGRFGNWLAQARDWNISRNRYWGNPLPIWRCDSCKSDHCLGSATELEELSGAMVPDLHKQFVDELTWSCKACNKGTMRRIPEVLDCWFESGSMPYAQIHYPFENKSYFEQAFPADFIAEGMDQTRGWFYTLMVIGTALFNKSPFKNVVVNGIILAEDGRKMSKRLKNYPDPMYVIDTYGADALRLYMMNSPAVRGDNLKFSEAGVKETLRQVLIPLWNVYSFFTTYGSIDLFKPTKNAERSSNPLDIWVLSRMQSLLAQVEKEMAEYRLYAVMPALLSFIDDLTNWYLRRSRRRFWSDNTQDKQAGYETLLVVLENISKALAPFLPFVTDAIYRNIETLRTGNPESVHLCDYPRADKSRIDAKLERDMKLVIRAVSLGRALRGALNIKVRQPLASITVITRNEGDAAVLQQFASHIQEELNVKAVKFSAAEEEFVEVVVKPNLPVLGPIFGKEMGALQKELKGLPREAILAVEDGGKVSVLGRELTAEHFLIERKPKEGRSIETSAGVTVFFDLQLTPGLEAEGLAREIVNRVQRMRKDAGFEISDRIEIEIAPQGALERAARDFEHYIADEVLAKSYRITGAVSEAAPWFMQQHDIDGAAIKIAVKRV